MNRKGIISYLVITFGLTYAVEGAMILSGFRFSGLTQAVGQYIVAGVMWAPALATFVTTRWITHEKLSSTGLRFGSWKPYLAVALIVPAGFILAYLLSWVLGLGAPDWQLSYFMGLVASTGADMSTAPSPALLIPLLFVSTLLVTPFVNSLFAFGEEWGWRGYLLPKLMPLGKTKAYLLLGIIWGLWHAPLIAIGFNYPGYPILGILAMCGLTTAIGISINELRLRQNSTLLAGWTHGVFNSQAYGVWRLLFPTVNPLLGGVTGLLGIAIWVVTGLLVLRFYRRRPQSAQLNPAVQGL
jgi:hypothetical protein